MDRSHSFSSRAIYRHNPSRMGHVVVYGVVVFVVWMFSLIVPFYAWILFVGVATYAFR